MASPASSDFSTDELMRLYQEAQLPLDEVMVMNNYNREAADHKEACRMNLIDEDDSSDSTFVMPEEHVKEIRVGEEFQAQIPPLQTEITNNRDEQLWSCDFAPEKVVEYLLNQGTTVHTNGCVADNEFLLYYLLQNGNGCEDFECEEIDTTKDFLDSWSEMECCAFESGIIKHGKDFFKIQRDFLMHRTVADLVRFYYCWKLSPRADEIVLYLKTNKRFCHFRNSYKHFVISRDIDPMEILVSHMYNDSIPHCSKSYLSSHVKMDSFRYFVRKIFSDS